MTVDIIKKQLCRAFFDCLVRTKHQKLAFFYMVFVVLKNTNFTELLSDFLTTQSFQVVRHKFLDKRKRKSAAIEFCSFKIFSALATTSSILS